MDDDREHHFFSVLGGAVEAARLGGLCVRVELEDGRIVEGVPEESPLSQGRGETEIDDSGVRADLVLGDTLVMTSRVRCFVVERP